jgi:hypothetical protein
MDEASRWKTRALLAERAHRWNDTVRKGKCTPDQQENMIFARSWYLHCRGELPNKAEMEKLDEIDRYWAIHSSKMPPGEAAKEIRRQIERHFPEPWPEIRTIIEWIKDLAPPGVSTRGRPSKK